MTTTKDQDRATGTTVCSASLRAIRTVVQYSIAIPSLVFLIAFVTLCGAPLAILFFLMVCPFATVHWAFAGNKSWWDSWKDSAKIFTE
jgi:hypothetical protein